jgi:hypothetical protein
MLAEKTKIVIVFSASIIAPPTPNAAGALSA